MKPSKPGDLPHDGAGQSRGPERLARSWSRNCISATRRARRTIPHAKPQEETIAFLKEQQWSLDFATELVGRADASASSFVVPARFSLRAGGQRRGHRAYRRPPGRSRRHPVGQTVTRGQVLAQIAPPASAPAR